MTSLHSSSLSLAGTPAASPLGYLSWTFGQGARDPYYIMVIIYIFASSEKFVGGFRYR